MSRKSDANIPIRLLLSPEFPASTKLIWMLLQIDKNMSAKERLSPTRIRRCTGLSRPTIRKGLAQLTSAGFPAVPGNYLVHTRAMIPRKLIGNPKISVEARVLYPVLRARVREKGPGDPMSYATLAKFVNRQPRTIRNAILSLVESGWLAISQENQRSPIWLTFPDPTVSHSRAEVLRAQQRLEKAKFRGECLALLWFDALVASTTYTDDAYPLCLTNPKTGHLMQIDRFYQDEGVALEFNGPQHDGPTTLISAEDAQAQMSRDRLKRQILSRQGITLISLRPEDLSLGRVSRILGGKLPLRTVRTDDPLLHYLERESRIYREAIRNIRKQSFPKIQQHHAAVQQT